MVSGAHSIPEATVGRLPLYLRALIDLTDDGSATVSSAALAGATGVNAAKVRKDLSHLGSYGTRGVGYDAGYLIHQIRRELGLTQDWSIVIAGIGNLGHALAGYRGFEERGFRVAGLLDVDEGIIGERIGELTVEPMGALERVVQERGVAIGVVATPAGAAQQVADRMVAAGLRSILNFAPVTLTVMPGVSVRKVDLAVELQILAYYEQRKATLDDVRRSEDVAAGSGPTSRS